MILFLYMYFFITLNYRYRQESSVCLLILSEIKYGSAWFIVVRTEPSKIQQGERYHQHGESGISLDQRDRGRVT